MNLQLKSRRTKAAHQNGNQRLPKSIVQRELLKNRAYEELKARILGNDYPPGSFLAERQLAEKLGMSKTPVKAALERLELEGYIAVSPQQGIVVRDLTIHEIADQYEIRTALECYILRSIAGRLTAEQIARLEENLAAQRAMLGQSDIKTGAALDAAFHFLLAEFLGNQEILRVMRQLREKMQRVVTQVFQIVPYRIDTSYEEHRGIADAVIRGDGEDAARRLDEHLQRGRQMILSRSRR